MATLLAHITVRAGAERQFEEIARTLFERTHTLEPAVLRYEYWRGATPRTYYTLLSFDDHRAFIGGHQRRADEPKITRAGFWRVIP